MSLLRSIGLNRNWLILLFTFLLLSVYFFRVHSSAVNDTFFHLAVGREVVQTHQIPQVDDFVYGAKSTKYVSSEWLSGVIFYLTLKSFGFTGLVVLRSLVGIVAIFFFYKTLRLTKISFLVAITMTFLVGYLLPFRLSTRPEMFSLAFLSLVNYVCLFIFFKNKQTFFLYLFPFVFLLWPNVHGFASLGGILLLLFTLIFTFKARNDKFKKVYLPFFLVSLISFSLYLIQYERVFVSVYAVDFSQYIGEWTSLYRRVAGSPSFLQKFTLDIGFFLFLFCFNFICLFTNIKRLKKSEKFVAVFYFMLLFLPFKFYRLIVPVLILTVPYFMFISSHSLRRIYSSSRLIKILYVIILAISIYSSVINHQVGNEKLVEVYPDKAKEFIQKHLNSKRLFTVYFWNDYFIWNIPGLKTFSDVMTQYKTLSELQEEKKLHTPKADVSSLIKKYNIDVIVNTQPEAEVLIGGSLTSVYNMPGWELVYIDSTSSVYARVDILKNKLSPLKFIHPELETPYKYRKTEEAGAVGELRKLLKTNSSNDFARSQLIYYYFVSKKDMNKAYLLAEESRKISPQNPFYSFILAAIFLNKHDCKEALTYAKESLSKNQYDEELKQVTYRIVTRCSMQ